MCQCLAGVGACVGASHIHFAAAVPVPVLVPARLHALVHVPDPVNVPLPGTADVLLRSFFGEHTKRLDPSGVQLPEGCKKELSKQTRSLIICTLIWQLTECVNTLRITWTNEETFPFGSAIMNV